MANNAGTLEIIAKEMGVIIEPLGEELGENFFEILGLRLPEALMGQSSWTDEIGRVITSVSVIVTLTTELVSVINDEDIEGITQKGNAITEELIIFIQSLKLLIATLDDLVDSTGELSAEEIADIKSFSEKLVKLLLDYLIIIYLEKKSPTTAAMFNFIGIAEKELKEPTSTIRPAYISRTLHLEKIFDLLKDPEQYLKDLYGWGNAAFNAEKFLQKFGEILQSFEIPVSLFSLTGNQQLDAILFSLSEDKLGALPYFNYEVRFPGAKDFVTTIPINNIWSASISTGARFEAGLTGELKPPFNISVSPEGTSQIQLAMGIVAKDPTGSMVVFGRADSSRLALDKFNSEIGLIVRQEGEFVNSEPIFKANLEGGKLYIDFSEGDGFLQNILSDIQLEGDFDLSTKWMPSSGLLLQGSGGVEIEIPTHIDLGVLIINSMVLGLGIMPDAPLKIETSTGLYVKFGPLSGTIERIGANAFFNFPENSDGNLGPLDLSFRFKPPNGVGLSIDAGAVKGGGYLRFDFDREEYAGDLELVISEWIALKAIGMITTKMPDGSKGFSLIIIISVEFGTGIQLGFGFTLLGVGGLLGLNRTVKIQPLAEGVRSGAADRIMFPQDVVANAPRIISDLRTFFPPQNDLFLIGPMANIGYGTPTLISLTLGVIIEFPNVDITILGVLKAALPDENAEVLKLQVNFTGRMEPSNKLLWFDARLFDSRILFITIEGGMGLLVNWGDRSNFVISVGGFHPRYNPPPLPFLEPPRLAITLLNKSWAKIRIEGYFAVTSNTVQFGARVELFFGVSAFNIDGHFAFDALFQFDPFYFIFELSLSLSVKLFGLGLFSVGFNGLLEGPTPWHIKGKGKIGFFFFSVSVPFEATWGEERHTELPPIEILPLIKQEFEAITNWEAVVPASSNILVTLRKLGESVPGTAEATETDNNTLVLHPVGKLRISQRKMPLNLELDKLGNQRPADVNNLSITAKIEGGSVLATPYVKEKFATGEFRDLNESSKLSSPGFVLYDSGVEIKQEGEQLKTSMAVKRVIRYETIIIDNNFKRHQIPFFDVIQVAFSGLHAALFGHFLKGNAVTKSTLSQNYRKKIQPNETVIQVLPNLYSVAFNDTNKPIDSKAMAFSSQAIAMDYMRKKTRENPNAAAQMHVIPNTEINLAA